MHEKLAGKAKELGEKKKVGKRRKGMGGKREKRIKEKSEPSGQEINRKILGETITSRYKGNIRRVR